MKNDDKEVIDELEYISEMFEDNKGRLQELKVISEEYRLMHEVKSKMIADLMFKLWLAACFIILGLHLVVLGFFFSR